MKRLAFVFACAMASNSAFALSAFEMPWKNADTTGAVYKSADHADGVFVLEFFANFCGPCNQNAANVDEMAEFYAEQERVQVLDIGIDTSDTEISRWIAAHHPNHPVLKDVGRTLWKELGGQYIPTMVVTDCHGEIVFQHTGVWDSSVKRQIKAKVDGLLAETCE
jgi:thiol-disulfide isomerase/thioredoxin